MAFWTSVSSGKLWLSDLFYEEPKLIYEDTKGAYPTQLITYPEELDLEFTPDDQHLIVSITGQPELNMIYHLETERLELWPYHCDLLAYSPHSGVPTTWCQSFVDETRFAVIEWGGEIWYSEGEPAEILVTREPGGHTNWAWSSDGARLVFWDPDDPHGDLKLYSRERDEIKIILPQSAYWLASDKLPRRGIEPASHPLDWGLAKQHVLVYAINNSGRCPIYYFKPIDEYLTAYPCWQIFDLDTETIVWGLEDLYTRQEEIPGMYREEYYPRAFSNPALSPDGRQVVINFGIPGRNALINYDLDTNQIADVFDWVFEKKS